MLKSLMLAVACAYINPPGLQPNAPVVQATVAEILKQAYAMEPGTQKEIIIDHGDGLCSKVMIEPSTSGLRQQSRTLLQAQATDAGIRRMAAQQELSAAGGI